MKTNKNLFRARQCRDDKYSPAIKANFNLRKFFKRKALHGDAIVFLTQYLRYYRHRRLPTSLHAGTRKQFKEVLAWFQSEGRHLIQRFNYPHQFACLAKAKNEMPDIKNKLSEISL